MRAIALLSLAAAACAPMAGETRSAGSGEPGAALVVANKFGNSLSKIDLASGREVARVDSCANPHELATSPDGAHVALACYGGTSVDVFRTADLSRVKRIELGDNARPHGIVWHADGDLYATAEGRQSIFRIADPLGETETFEFASGKQGTHMLAVAPDARHAWTVDLGSKTVTLIDLAPDGRALWVSARGSDMAFALDPQTLEVRHEVATGDFPLRLAIRPQGDVAVTSDLADGTLTVIDLAAAKAVRTISVSSRAEAEARQQVTVVWSDDGSRIYVAETASDTIAEVDYAGGRVLRRLATGDGGDGLAIVD